MLRSCLKRILLLLVVLSLPGCLDLSDVQKFTRLAADAGERFPNLSADFSASCQRLWVYQAIEESKYAPKQLEDIIKAAVSGVLPDPVAQARCKQFEDEKPRLDTVNAALTNYLQTMGDLAADGLTSYDTNLDNLAKSLTAGKFVDDAQVKAVNGLAKYLATAVTDSYRRCQIASTVTDHNNDIQQLTAGLKKVVNAYRIQLSNEQGGMRSYYKKSIQQHLNALPSGALDPLPMIAIKKHWDEEESDIQTKVKAAEAYQQILDKIGSAHNALLQNAQSLDTKELKTLIMQHVKALRPLVADVQKVF